MSIPAIRAIMLRDLAAVRRTVETYPDESDLWQMPAGLPNCGGTLVLHLAGGLQHFIGAVLGNTGYRRDRDAEFSRRNVQRHKLLAEIDAATAAVERGLDALVEESLTAPYPIKIDDRTLRTGDWLLQLMTHLAFHLGQLDYHRRLVTGDSSSIGALSLDSLPDAGTSFPAGSGTSGL